MRHDPRGDRVPRGRPAKKEERSSACRPSHRQSAVPIGVGVHFIGGPREPADGKREPDAARVLRRLRGGTEASLNVSRGRQIIPGPEALETGDMAVLPQTDREQTVTSWPGSSFTRLTWLD